ncbi:hypothetical protein [Streptomyces nitrosporeus]|uniref:hypothetical protein n=1 Tax=Streptomyces nitrosporeus TaxID=28894 RepID=UPI00399FAA16
MKALLWTLLCLAAAANLLLNLMEDGAPRIALSACAGAVVIGSGIGLWFRREPRESGEY